MVAVHEAAHAFATKHFGRKVRRGGLLIYFGSPAFFVDTMDIWMEPKKSRIAVSAAGPYSGLLVGSMCMLIIAGTGFADTTLNSVIFKVAIWAFVFGALTNLNPLLEWDGYFILMDWLEIPMLRKRSLDFVRRNMMNKIFLREAFTREEKIFAVFGVTALMYTVTMIGVALFFWQSRVSNVLESVGGWVFWLLIGLIVLVLGIPAALAVGVLGYRAAHRGQIWIYQHFLMGRPGNQIAALVSASIVVALPSTLLGGNSSDTYTVVAAGLALLIGLLFAIRVAPWYLGSQLQWFFLALPWAIGVLMVALVLSYFSGPVSAVAGAVALGVIPVVLFLALSYLSPTLISFNRTTLQGAWALMTTGVTLLLIGALVARLTTDDAGATYVNALTLLGYATIAASLYRLGHRLDALRPEQPAGVASQAISDAERLSG